MLRFVSSATLFAPLTESDSWEDSWEIVSEHKLTNKLKLNSNMDYHFVRQNISSVYILQICAHLDEVWTVDAADTEYVSSAVDQNKNM